MPRWNQDISNCLGQVRRSSPIKLDFDPDMSSSWIRYRFCCIVCQSTSFSTPGTRPSHSQRPDNESVFCRSNVWNPNSYNDILKYNASDRLRYVCRMVGPAMSLDRVIVSFGVKFVTAFFQRGPLLQSWVQPPTPAYFDHVNGGSSWVRISFLTWKCFFTIFDLFCLRDNFFGSQPLLTAIVFTVHCQSANFCWSMHCVIWLDSE